MTMDDAAIRRLVEGEIRAKATRRVRARMGLIWHAAIYAMTSGALIAINQAYTPGNNWFVWPVAAWGAAVVLHGIATMQIAGDTTEDMIQAEIAKEKARRGIA